MLRSSRFVLILLPLLLCGCWNGRVLLAFEQPFWDAQQGDRLLRWPLLRAAVLHGYAPTLLVIGPPADPRGRLQQELAGGRYRAAVVSPLLSLEPQSFAPSFPKTSFLLLGSAAGTVLPANAARLVFDRADAFREAGRAAGISIREEAGGAQFSGLASRIGVLVSQRPAATARDLDAFMTGVAEALDGGRPSVRALGDVVDRNALKTTIVQMRTEGVEIFLLLLGAPDSWCLEAMRDAGGSAIVSDWASSGAFPSHVFLSIETDIPDGVARFLSGAKTADVNGRVRLVAGAARPIPPEVSAEISPR